MHKEEGASCFHDVHCGVNVLDPGWKSKVAECSRLSLHNRALHCPEHRFCGNKVEKAVRSRTPTLQFICNTELLKTVTMDEVCSGSARNPEGCVDAGFNLGHKVADGTFFDVRLLVMFNPEVSFGRNISQLG